MLKHDSASPTPILTLIPGRYAETQEAPNGLRYRDWVCTFANKDVIEKCRLEAHILDIAGYHQAFVPWKSAATGAVELVLTRSSLPIEQRVMHDRTPQDQKPGVSRFTAFVRSCKARLLQDLKTLPTRGDTPQQPIIERHNTSFYEDELAGQILLVYAPDGGTQLEFVSMSLLPTSK